MDAAPAAAKRQELAEALKAELDERLHRCKAKIDAVLAEENCVLIANAGMEEVSPGKFCTVVSTAIRSL